MQQTSAVRPVCRACGLPIEDMSYIGWNGHNYHNDHVPSHEPPWSDRADVGRKIVETSQAMSEGYKRGITSFSTESEREASEKCAIAASNTGYFIMQALGFTGDEIKAMADAYRRS